MAQTRAAAANLLAQLHIPETVTRRALSAVEIPDDASTRAFLESFERISPYRVWEAAASINVATAALIASYIELHSGKVPKTVVSPVHSTLQLASQHFITLDGEKFDEDIMARVIKVGGYGSVMTGLFPFADGRHLFLHKSMSAKQTLEALDFTKEDQKVFRELDVKDKVAAMDMLKRKIKETGLTAEEAEARLWKNGACTAMVRTRDECLQTEQGKLLAKMPLIVTDSAGSVAKPAGKPNFNPLQPLAGLKIVDMSRILAGPHASKLLASLGATVLKISHPPDIDTFIMDTSLGKRSAILDLKKEADRNVFLDEILPDTDILIQGYRSGKLDKLGLGFSQLSSKIDSLIASGLRSPTRPLYYASENCYGPSGPLSHHGGWEQIAQAFTGLALPLNAEKPRMLPLTVLDMMTGGALALGILAALLKPTGHTHIQTSLCQTAFYIQSFGVRTEVAVDRRLPADLIGEKDVASMTPALLKMLQPTLDPLLATNPGWFGQHEKGARGNLGFLRPAFGLQTDTGPVYGRWKWSSRVNGHDSARWMRDEEAGDGDAEMGGSVVWSGVDARL